MSVKIYDTDTYYEIAQKIYKGFEPLQSCTVVGFVTVDESIIPKGELVMLELQEMYDAEHTYTIAGGRKIKKFKYKEKSVGGPIAHPIFSFDKKVVNKEPRYTIWRVQ